jgi:S-DNA-T family DNA segregation ATPase FtsK/SpoIIIE
MDPKSPFKLNQPLDRPSLRTRLHQFWAALLAEFAAQWRLLRGGLSSADLSDDDCPPESEAPPKAPVQSKTPELSLDKLKQRFASRQSKRERRRLQRLLEEKQEAEMVHDDTPDLAISEDSIPATEVAPMVPAVEAPRPVAVPPPEATPAAPKKPAEPYRLPQADLLSEILECNRDNPDELARNQEIIQETLDSFGIDAEVVGATRGPRVTLFKINPARGVAVESISRLSNNLAMELSAISLRIMAPVPGQDYVGIEVPNQHADPVQFAALLAGELWQRTRAKIPLLVGKDINGGDVILDLAKAPHLLIAGATGSGKSVCLNGMIMSLLYRFSPEDLRLVLVDPKVVEFNIYNALPHLITPVITKTEKVVGALRWVIEEMEHRYRILSKVGARNLEGFNARPPDPQPVYDDFDQLIPAKLPYVVLVIDELADIMMTARGDVETSLARIAQMSRAVGIHTIIATQRPSVNVITGIIKANYPTRIAFQVSSQIDSRTIIDGKGAEALLGRGDMLFNPPGAGRLRRLQGALVDDDEIERVVEFSASQSEQVFNVDIFKSVEDEAPAVESTEEMMAEDEALIEQAIDIVVSERRASTSYVQRRLRIGYNRAATIIEILEQRGIVGPQIGSNRREILVECAEESE